MIKGGTFLEVAGTIKAIAFDKTGTLTAGKPKVSKIMTLKGSEQEIISVARTIEEHSQHPIALAIMNYAKANNISSQKADSFKALLGKGAQASIEGTEYFAGKPGVFREMGLSINREVQNCIDTSQNEGNTIVMVGTKTKLLGIILVSDYVHEVTVTALKKLKDVGIEQIVMLTGFFLTKAFATHHPWYGLAPTASPYQAQPNSDASQPANRDACGSWYSPMDPNYQPKYDWYNSPQYDGWDNVYRYWLCW